MTDIRKVNKIEEVKPENSENVNKTETEKEVVQVELQNQNSINNYGETNVIKKGKSLRQINAMFRYDKPSSNW